MKFEHFSLDPRVVAGVTVAGYTQPTPIQQAAIPLVLQGQDVLGLAQTGTGKTAAFLLPILNRLISGKRGAVRALIVAPTRELAEQIHQAAVILGQPTRLRSVAIYGGVSKQRQLADLRRGPDIVVACPGRLLDLIGEGAVNLARVEVLVLDEADQMCDMGFLPDIRRILGHLPARRQTLFFSATMPLDIRTLADEILREPAVVQVDASAPAKTVAHALYPVSEGQKSQLLLAMLAGPAIQRALVFTRTKRRARSLAVTLEQAGHKVTALQGNMGQSQRQQAIDGFRRGSFDILVATDIAARGIDVADVSHVINYDMPDTVDAYTHRIGRTGRAQRTGEAYTLTQPGDEALVRSLERLMGTKIERRTLPGFDYTPSATRPAPAQTPRNGSVPQRRSPRSDASTGQPAPVSASQQEPTGGRSGRGSRRRRPQGSPQRPGRPAAWTSGPRHAPAGSQPKHSEG